MAKESQYIYNPETSSYDLYVPSSLTKWTRFGIVVLIGLAFFFTYFWLWNGVLKKNTPKTAILERQNKVMLASIAEINERMEDQNAALSELQERDNVVYRSVFGMDEIPQAVRNAGFGGVDRYADLRLFMNADYLITTRNRLDILTKKAYVQSLSFDDIQALSARAGDMANCVPSIYPVVPTKSMQQTSPFGYRSDPINGGAKFHSGIDIGGPTGTDIFCTGDGVVVRVDYNYYGYGIVVDVDHGFGYTTRYGHLLSASVMEGQRVKRGDKVGELGSSGRVTGPHLHYEVIYRGNAVNPWNFFSTDITPEEYKDMIQKSRSRG
ncbi:MAG: M23 family metallopeptidase [Bacteroidales bacterium]|nr:M23 family metallopeptidase [Bacteroidales bacterium]MBO7487222.1 M23 family metallopeptidase [Bacteroidales bacterium]